MKQNTQNGTQQQEYIRDTSTKFNRNILKEYEKM
jgi:hypothetical protein